MFVHLKQGLIDSFDVNIKNLSSASTGAPMFR